MHQVACDDETAFKIMDRAREAGVNFIDTANVYGNDGLSELYQIHMQHNDTPEQETLRALDDLVRQGKVLYIGVSNYAAYRLGHRAHHWRAHPRAARRQSRQREPRPERRAVEAPRRSESARRAGISVRVHRPQQWWSLVGKGDALSV